jgi:hypothetical protein
MNKNEGNIPAGQKGSPLDGTDINLGRAARKTSLIQIN